MVDLSQDVSEDPGRDFPISLKLCEVALAFPQIPDRQCIGGSAGCDWSEPVYIGLATHEGEKCHTKRSNDALSRF